MSSEIEITYSKPDYQRFRRLLLKRKELNGCIACGSCSEIPFEYMIANLTDADKLYWIKIASPAGHSSETFKRHESESLIVDTKDCHDGFARLRQPDTLQENEQKSYYPKPSVPLPEKVRIKGPSWQKSLNTESHSNGIR